MQWHRSPTETEVRAHMMKVLIGVDPHKTSVTVAVVDEAVGELVECATFLQNLEKASEHSNVGRNGSASVVGR